MLAASRRLLGTKEDIRHKRYRRLKKALLAVFSQHSNLVYIAGHDHNLQHMALATNQYIVSGAASKATYVRPGGKADFVAKTLGYFVADVSAEGVSLSAQAATGTVLQTWQVGALANNVLATH